MKYQPSLTPIPFDRRQEINNKILSLISKSKLPEGITNEDIANGYTGVGGLHGLQREDFENFYEYTEGKKEIEQGQFFTNSAIVEFICKMLPVHPTDLICDLCCGAGAFFNSFDENQCYGCDIDNSAVKVAKFLYPGANIECCDIRYYNPDVRFDFVVGNPPFNLKWTVFTGNIMDSEDRWKRITHEKETIDYLSQYYYCIKAFEILKPGGLLICVVPDSYLKDEFFTKKMITSINERFNFIFQYKLPATAFKNNGVLTFDTKVICFQAHADSAIARTPYSSVYVTPDDAARLLINVGEDRHALKTKLHRETLAKFSSTFNYTVNKYLYEIKHHAILKPYISKAIAKLHQLQHQKMPTGIKPEDWAKSMLTENKVLAFMRGIIHLQSKKSIDKYALVMNKTYGIKWKAYSRKMIPIMKKEVKYLSYDFYSMMESDVELPERADAGIKRMYAAKKKRFDLQRCLWKKMGQDEAVNAYLDKFKFRKPDGSLYKFNQFQKEDLSIVLQKQYAILNWQMGTGKTAASAAWAKWKPQRNTFIIGPALAIELTWEPFMKLHGKKYVVVRSLKDINSIEPGVYVCISMDYVVKYKRQIMKYFKRQSQKINVIFDEIDEITHPNSKRTYATLACFRRAKRKLLATGTTTRNNITELYSQLELLYNNSHNMQCECRNYWIEDEKEGDLKRRDNPYWGQPFPARGGSLWFKRCFNPAKSTVFGIQRHDQNIYNEPELRRILEYSIITRKFKNIVGDKYTITSRKIVQSEQERTVYRAIITELSLLLPEYYQSTGNSRKDTMLRVLRQMQLLIKATSMPQSFNQYADKSIAPNKALAIKEEVASHHEKIAIGCTSIEAVNWYCTYLGSEFPIRPIFKVIGDVSFKNREVIRAQFEASVDGILICTQQSLKSSVNIPSCSKVIIESKQWNIPKIEQFFFRFIRYDSPNNTEVLFINYENTIEMNLMALLMAKERLNDYIKTLEFKENSDVYDEYDIDLDILNSIITKEHDEDGKVVIKWGDGAVV